MVRNDDDLSAGVSGRIAIYYEAENGFSGNFTPGHLQKSDTADTLFNADFETANLSQWTSNVNDGGNLSASDFADYWGLQGLSALVNDNNAIYVQNDMPDGSDVDTLPDPQTQYRARFYVNPNSLTMATNDVLDLFTGRNAAGSDVVRIQLQKTATSYQIRSGLLNDAGTWTDTSWYNVPNAWSAVEIQYQAFANSGSLTLWLDDPSTSSGQAVQKQSLTFIDNDTRTVTEVRLGAQGIETGTRGTVYFDDFESRRFSYIGTLPDPGVNDPQATNAPGWTAFTYTYSATIPHAVTSVSIEGGSTNSYEYDLNGNMTCRVEGGVTFKQDYNAENRISAIHKMNGTCSTGTVTESWLYGYDGDGIRVTTAHYTGVTLDSLTLYYMGGAYEVTGSAVKKYYSMAGQTIMRDSDGSLKYLLTDHLGSTTAVVEQNGNLLSQQRYLPFGEVRTIPNSPVTQTDFWYTGQRNLSGTGLMDYRARMYSQSLGRFIQPDSIIPNPANPQSFNRFSYVNNRPINFSDPSGHDPWFCGGNDSCLYNWLDANTKGDAKDKLFDKYDVTINGEMNPKEKRAAMKALYDVGSAFARERNLDEDASTAFKEVYDPITINRVDSFNYTDENGIEHPITAGCKTEGNIITCASFGDNIWQRYQSVVNNIVHELGHVFDPVTVPGTGSSGLPQAFVDNATTILHDNSAIQWRVNTSGGHNEEFANFFVAWVYGTWGPSADYHYPGESSTPRNWMTTNMSEWIP